MNQSHFTTTIVETITPSKHPITNATFTNAGSISDPPMYNATISNAIANPTNPILSLPNKSLFSYYDIDREKVMRSLKTDDSPILTGMQIFHNYIRSHMGIDGDTPSKRAGIKVEELNKWITIIQNASKI
ncbi:hypothetical protein [Nitrosopumilus sp.]|uniref:hypothetical protein n=1 Tax=Nitrosopumilus sp. TaxID=2024843 RepID=UPI00247B3F60|nr:hypothetical protein [Nitrosopumilus sp.]MCV0410311.1 hypothetical protein [Nitrosopumilus sp.]